MFDILQDQISGVRHPALEKFYKEFFDRKPKTHTAAYVKYLRERIADLHDNLSVHTSTSIDLNLKLNQVLVQEKTPWTVVVGNNHEFDLWQAVADSKKNLRTYRDWQNHPTVPNPDEIEWGPREQEFVKTRMLDGGYLPFITHSAKHGFLLHLAWPERVAIDLGPSLKLNLKSRPA